MKKYRKKLIREKAVIAIYQKLLVDINEEEVHEYLNSDKELANNKDDYDYCFMLIMSIAGQIEKYKAEVAKYLRSGWSIERLSKMELAILLVGCYELLETEQGKEVIINEAVELSKKYCDEDSYKFINGLLNKIK
ncbi:MAG: transcription antitermination factor NusB [Thomasclavelia sp.]|uniref:transcription antitermination factor NusB n=1 Tax=Thomasclavelia sp. TaxID=3025757 RepID=UPI00399FBE42